MFSIPEMPDTTVQKMTSAITILMSLIKPSPSGFISTAVAGQKCPSATHRDENLDVQDPVPGFTAFRRDEIWHFFSSQPFDRWHEVFTYGGFSKICVARRLASRIVSDAMVGLRHAHACGLRMMRSREEPITAR